MQLAKCPEISSIYALLIACLCMTVIFYGLPVPCFVHCVCRSPRAEVSLPSASERELSSYGGQAPSNDYSTTLPSSLRPRPREESGSTTEPEREGEGGTTILSTDEARRPRNTAQIVGADSLGTSSCQQVTSTDQHKV